MAKLWEVIHALAAAVWLGAAGLSGVAASVVFTRLDGLDPTLGKFAAYDGDHARLAGGWIASTIFAIADAAMFVAVALALLAAIILLATGGVAVRRFSTFVRLAALGGGVILVAYQLLFLGHEMNEQLKRYWAAAEAGDSDAANGWRDAFLSNHPAASAVVSGLALCALATLVVGVWSALTNAAATDNPDAVAAARTPGGLETPALARGSRSGGG